MEAIARHDFAATAEDELSFRKGNVLKVRSRLSMVARLILILGMDAKILPTCVSVNLGEEL